MSGQYIYRSMDAPVKIPLTIVITASPVFPLDGDPMHIISTSGPL